MARAGDLRRIALGMASILLAPEVGAATMDGGRLTPSEAAQLQIWSGGDPLSFSQIYSGTAGLSTAASFHAAVDDAGPTYTIYDIHLRTGGEARIGGYTRLSWGLPTGYQTDPTAFIFNLTSAEVQTLRHPAEAIWTDPTRFAVFGAADISFSTEDYRPYLPPTAYLLGCVYATSKAAPDCTLAPARGSSHAYSYGGDQGQIVLAGDSGDGWGSTGLTYDTWSVRGIEVYRATPRAGARVTPVPLPPTLSLLLAGWGMLAGWGIRAALMRRRGFAPGGVRR